MIQIDNGSSITLNGQTFTDNSVNWKTDLVKTNLPELIRKIICRAQECEHLYENGSAILSTLNVVQPALYALDENVSLESAAYCAGNTFDMVMQAIDDLDCIFELTPCSFPYYGVNQDLSKAIVSLNKRNANNYVDLYMSENSQDELKIYQIACKFMGNMTYYSKCDAERYGYNLEQVDYADELKNMFIKKCEIYLLMYYEILGLFKKNYDIYEQKRKCNSR